MSCYSNLEFYMNKLNYTKLKKKQNYPSTTWASSFWASLFKERGPWGSQKGKDWQPQKIGKTGKIGIPKRAMGKSKALVVESFGGCWQTILTLSQFVTLDSVAGIYTPLIMKKPVLAVS